MSSIVKSVYVSGSRNIHWNLALENWLYEKYDFSRRNLLLLWRNAPSVVIGRHQNTWLECDVNYAHRKGIELARRSSGGGAVYHDLGNLNATFFTCKARYDRRHNLSIVVEALRKELGFEVGINDREDIVFNEYKISGTASKVGSKNTYHHCTVLVDSNKNVMSKVLRKDNSVKTNATKSVPAKVMNVSEYAAGANCDRLITALGLEYLQTCPVEKRNLGWDFSKKQMGFQIVQPSEKCYPGISDTYEKYVSWNWIWGRNPKFEISRKLDFSKISWKFAKFNDVYANVIVDKGLITSVTVDLSSCTFDFIAIADIENICFKFKNRDFNTDLFEDLKLSLIPLLGESLQTECKNF